MIKKVLISLFIILCILFCIVTIIDKNRTSTDNKDYQSWEADNANLLPSYTVRQEGENNTILFSDIQLSPKKEYELSFKHENYLKVNLYIVVKDKDDNIISTLAFWEHFTKGTFTIPDTYSDSDKYQISITGYGIKLMSANVLKLVEVK